MKINNEKRYKDVIKHVFVFFIFGLIFVSCNKKEVLIEKLKLKNDIYFLNNKEYSGKAYEYNDNKIKIKEINIKNGKLYGWYIEYSEEGNLELKTYFEEGIEQFIKFELNEFKKIYENEINFFNEIAQTLHTGKIMVYSDKAPDKKEYYFYSGELIKKKYTYDKEIYEYFYKNRKIYKELYFEKDENENIKLIRFNLSSASN